MGPFPARATAWIAGVTILAMLLISGCGGSSSRSSSTSSTSAGSSSTSQASQTGQSTAQFKAAIAPILNQFKLASQGTGAAIQQAVSQTDAQVSAAFQQVAAKWTTALNQLKTLQPPPQLTAAYDRLKTQVSSVTADLGTIVSAAQSHNATAAKDATKKLVNDILSAKATATTISNGTG